MRILLTGAAGFVGHHVARHLEESGHEVIAMVRMNKIGDANRLREIGFQGEQVWHDLASPIVGTVASRLGTVDAVVHLAGETHVDRSIVDPAAFALANVVGTTNLLVWAEKHCHDGRFLQFSTDEVFGPAPCDKRFSEDEAHNPRNPYAASKSGAEAMVQAFRNTYGFQTTIVRSMNIFGERQHREKFVPMCIRKILAGQMIRVHADPTCTIAGSRFYIHAGNVARGITFVLEHGEDGPYHLVGEREVDNAQMLEEIAGIIGKSASYQLVNFHSSRPGHDLRYALADNRLRALGWRIPQTFEESLTRTVRWYLEHREWL